MINPEILKYRTLAQDSEAVSRDHFVVTAPQTDKQAKTWTEIGTFRINVYLVKIVV